MTAPQHCGVWPEIPDTAVTLETLDWPLGLKDRPVRRDLRGNWGTERAGCLRQTLFFHTRNMGCLNLRVRPPELVFKSPE